MSEGRIAEDLSLEDALAAVLVAAEVERDLAYKTFIRAREDHAFAELGLQSAEADEVRARRRVDDLQGLIDRVEPGVIAAFNDATGLTHEVVRLPGG